MRKHTFQKLYFRWRDIKNIMFQEVFIIDDTLKKNIAFGVPEKNIDPEKLQSYYATVDDLHDETKCPIPKNQLKISKGIEVGHIFYFGTKYSEKLGAYVDNNKGEKVAVHMGSYGIGISRLVGAIIEAYHDNNGII